nr:MAG TPA: hypothetical protein [Caudoviricetes sp.]
MCCLVITTCYRANAIRTARTPNVRGKRQKRTSRACSKQNKKRWIRRPKHESILTGKSYPFN